MMRYDTDYKEHYRREVWKCLLEENCYGREDVRSIFILDTGAAEETRHLVSVQKIKPSQLIVCNHSAAHVASVTRAFPGVKTYGTDAARAFEDLSGSRVVVSHANLDFCSNIGWPVLHQLRRIGQSGVLGLEEDGVDDSASVCITLLGGRETPAVSRFLAECGADSLLATKCKSDTEADWGSCTERDRHRLSVAALATGREATVVRAWKYRSPSKQPMIVGAFSMPSLEEPVFPSRMRAENRHRHLRWHEAAVQKYKASLRVNRRISEMLMSQMAAA